VAELNSYRDLIADRGVEVIIHRAAVVRQERHLMTEKAYAFKIGSTMKGVGAAVIDKIKRDPDSPVLIGDVGADGMALRAIPEVRIVDSYEWIKILYKHCQQILIEGSQGYSLSINHGFYPYVTSRDCTVQQLAVDCGVPWAMMRLATIHGVARTYPIRVANRFDENGTQIGTSGPCYPDQQEITWGSISQEPELTTVTKLPRRLFTFSEIQFLDALLMNGVGHVFLNFVNYLRPEGVKLDWFVNSARLAGAEIRWVGHGPNETDIREI
jgi:adenylosuccinate synthase